MKATMKLAIGDKRGIGADINMKELRLQVQGADIMQKKTKDYDLVLQKYLAEARMRHDLKKLSVNQLLEEDNYLRESPSFMPF